MQMWLYMTLIFHRPQLNKPDFRRGPEHTVTADLHVLLNSEHSVLQGPGGGLASQVSGGLGSRCDALNLTAVPESFLNA